MSSHKRKPNSTGVLKHIRTVLVIIMIFIFGLLIGTSRDLIARFFTGQNVEESSPLSHIAPPPRAHASLPTSATPYGRPPRLLFMTASYTKNQLTSLQKTLDCMRDHCNAGWNVTIVMQVAWEDTDIASDPRIAELRDRLYCAATDEAIPLIIEPYGKIGFGLNSRHRLYLRAHMMDYDYVSYAEEDMQLSVSHLAAYIKGEAELKRLFPRTWVRYQVGFLRWEDSLVDSERVSWEYFPDKIHAVDLYKQKDTHAARRPLEGIYIVTNNLNQAIFVMSREQVEDLQARCGFLSDIGQGEFFKELRRAMNKDWKYLSAGVSEWSSSYQQVLQCGVRRVVPAEHLQSYMIHHAENKAQKRRLRTELLNARDWDRIVAQKAASPITIERAYDEIVYQQYNLHLINKQAFEGKSKWTYGVERE